MTNYDKDTLRILVEVSDNSSFGDTYLKLRSEIVTVEGDGRICRLSYDGRENLAVNGQLDGGHARTHGYAADFYGTDLELRDLYSARLYELERIVKAMRAIQNKMDRITTQFGAPVDTAQRLANFATAVGTTAKLPFWRRVGKAQHMYSDSPYIAMTADDLRYWVKGEIRKWIDERGLVSQVSDKVAS